MTVFPESELFQEIQEGKFIEASEQERLLELRTFISALSVKTTLLGNTVSNTIPFVGMVPDDKVRILNELDAAIRQSSEIELKQYRNEIRSIKKKKEKEGDFGYPSDCVNRKLRDFSRSFFIYILTL